MALWLGMVALALLAIIIPTGYKQRRTLDPIFEREPTLQAVAEIPGFPFSSLEGPWLRGVRYSFALAAIRLASARWLEREASRMPCTKAEFMQHFSPGDVRRALIFTTLAFTYVVVIILGYFLMPADR